MLHPAHSLSLGCRVPNDYYPVGGSRREMDYGARGDLGIPELDSLTHPISLDHDLISQGPLDHIQPERDSPPDMITGVTIGVAMLTAADGCSHRQHGP